MGGVKSVEVAVHSKEENLADFCPKYVQEFDLCTTMYVLPYSYINSQKHAVSKACNDRQRIVSIMGRQQIYSGFFNNIKYKKVN